MAYRPAAKKTVRREKTPADVNTPSLMIRQLGLGLDQSFRCPDSTLNPISSIISPTAKQSQVEKKKKAACQDKELIGLADSGSQLTNIGGVILLSAISMNEC